MDFVPWLIFAAFILFIDLAAGWIKRKSADVEQRTRETFEREYLRVQIRRFSGNISRTATFIGMERSALHRKLKALGIGDPKNEEGE